MTPNFLAPKYELLNDSEVKELIDDKMQSKKKQGFTIQNSTVHSIMKHWNT